MCVVRSLWTWQPGQSVLQVEGDNGHVGRGWEHGHHWKIHTHTQIDRVRQTKKKTSKMIDRHRTGQPERETF